MLFPSQKMRQTVLVAEPGEDLGDGATFGADRQLRCTVDYSTQLVRDAQGDQVTIAATLLCRPGPNVPAPGWRCTIDGDVRTVMRVDPARSPSGRVRGYQVMVA